MQGGFPPQGLPQGNKLQTPIYVFCQPYLQWDAEGGLQGVRALPTWKTKPGEENPAKKSSPSFSISLHKLIVGKKKPEQYHCLRYPNLHLTYALHAGLSGGRGIRP